MIVSIVNPDLDSEGFLCSRCGQHHARLPLAYGPQAPVLYFDIPKEEREARCNLSSDICIIDQEYFFIVGNLEIPLLEMDRKFSWDVWVSLSRDSMKRILDLWDFCDRIHEPPFFGWLNTVLPAYPDTLSLRSLVHTRKVGRRPYIELEATDHPLAIEQRTGITLARVQEIAEIVMHPQNI